MVFITSKCLLNLQGTSDLSDPTVLSLFSSYYFLLCAFQTHGYRGSIPKQFTETLLSHLISKYIFI